ncbi:basic proline-rich protein-like [Lynx canadensis]|uniref:basic proline-rich protein-like n=1 Tax=Lynx canadensis TaxID=61383 RepID=UPI0011B06463|nr:basic proline-rich protein-like [Lynx canadensis]
MRGGQGQAGQALLRPEAPTTRPAQPLDSAPRPCRPPRPSRRPRAPLLGSGAREDGTLDPVPVPRAPPGGFGPVPAWKPAREDGRWSRSPGRERRAQALGVGTPAGGGPRACTPTSAPGFVRRMQAPSPARPRVSPGPRPGLRGGGRSPGGASGARRARARAAAAASGPRAAAAATALSRHRPRRPPPRARPLAPPRPEPPPGPPRRRRPPLRFVFPSLAVPCLCLPPAPTPRSRHSHHPRGPRALPAARRLRRRGSRDKWRSGDAPWAKKDNRSALGPLGASVSPGWPSGPPGSPWALRFDRPRGGGPVPAPTPPPAAESSRRQGPPPYGRPRKVAAAAGTRSRHARLRGRRPCVLSPWAAGSPSASLHERSSGPPPLPSAFSGDPIDKVPGITKGSSPPRPPVLKRLWPVFVALVTPGSCGRALLPARNQGLSPSGKEIYIRQTSKSRCPLTPFNTRERGLKM